MLFTEAKGPVHVVLISLVTVLVAVASGVGVLVPGLYRDNALVQAAWYGNDLVTLVLAVPLLVLSVLLMCKGRGRGLLLGLGMLAYSFYNYAFYLFGAAYNPLFLVYAGILVFATLGLIAGFTSEELRAVRRHACLSRLDRGVGLLILAICVVLGSFWIAVSIDSLLSGKPPAMVEATGHPTNVTAALDLWLVVTFGLLGGVWLIKGRAWGHVISTVWAVKGAVYMIALSAAATSAFLRGASDSLVELGLWVPIAIGCTVAASVLLRFEPMGKPA